MSEENAVRISPAPTLDLSVSPREGGWQVTAGVTNFDFEAPNEAASANLGKGHGHLYLNGLKLQRMYQHTAKIGALPPGQHSVTMSLNTGLHQLYWNVDGPVRDTVLILAE